MGEPVRWSACIRDRHDQLHPIHHAAGRALTRKIRGSSNALMAARRLYAAWRRDDREAALDVGTSEAVAHLVGMNPRSSLTGPERCAVDGPSYVCKPRPSTSSSSLPRDVLLFVVQGDANGLRVTSTAIWEEESPGHYAIITTASASP